MAELSLAFIVGVAAGAIIGFRFAVWGVEGLINNGTPRKAIRTDRGQSPGMPPIGKAPPPSKK